MLVNLPDSPDLPRLADILKSNPGWLDEGISTPEAADILGYTRLYMKRMRQLGTGPAYYKAPGGKVSYTRRLCFEYQRASGELKRTKPTPAA